MVANSPRPTMMVILVAVLLVALLAPLVDLYTLVEHQGPRGMTNHVNNRIIRRHLKRSVVEQSETNELKIDYETKWFRQPVDHFSWANQDTWLQRYLVNKVHCAQANCPILFYTGNEGDIEVFTNNTGFMWENAQKFGAMLVFAEHRFYGQSMPYKIDPTKINPNETHTLGYLTSEQALADFARLVRAIKGTLYDAKYSPVIVLGGSYGGMLSAWMRMKYPNLVDGALAGSAPILQFPNEYKCNTFQQIVTKDFENYSKNCSKSINMSWDRLRNFARDNKEENLNLISKLFNTCKVMQSKDVDNLIGLLEGIWVNMAMTDYANPATFLSNMPAYPIKHACNQLQLDPINDENDYELIGRISLASQVYTNYTNQVPCLDIDKLLFDPMDVLWGFQACTEMVMPICSDGVNDMFDPQPFDLRQYTADCLKQWGVMTQVDKVETLYGVEKDALEASRIIFSSATRDPWSAGCPNKSNEKNEIYAIVIEGACHHEDLRPSGPGDTEPLKAARKKEIEIISKWIEQHYKRVAERAPNDTVVIHYDSPKNFPKLYS